MAGCKKDACPHLLTYKVNKGHAPFFWLSYFEFGRGEEDNFKVEKVFSTFY